MKRASGSGSGMAAALAAATTALRASETVLTKSERSESVHVKLSRSATRRDGGFLHGGHEGRRAGVTMGRVQMGLKTDGGYAASESPRAGRAHRNRLPVAAC
jgi:hypothetical protein